jgi:soluble lytic murein transglycosylase-like protein
MRRYLLTLLFAGHAVAAAPHSGAGTPVANRDVKIGSFWEEGARVSGIPEQKLYAIAIQESGLKMKDGKIRPWPWTINSPEGARRFKTKEEAYAHIRELLQRGITNIDIGALQINLRWHWKRIRNRDILDPRTNILAASEILREELANTRGDIKRAVANYHSPRRLQKGAAYEASVANYEKWISASLAPQPVQIAKPRSAVAGGPAY